MLPPKSKRRQFFGQRARKVGHILVRSFKPGDLRTMPTKRKGRQEEELSKMTNRALVVVLIKQLFFTFGW
jgi:hypothetical protein